MAPWSRKRDNAVTMWLQRSIVGTVVACAQLLAAPTSLAQPKDIGQIPSAQTPASAQPAPITQPKSRWVPVPWSELPGLHDDPLYGAWSAWLKSCEKPLPVFAPVCREVRQLSIASNEEQVAWLKTRLQAYRVEALTADDPGLLTAYFEPVLSGSRTATADFKVPLYRAPAGLEPRKPWFSRKDIDSLPEAQAPLRGREIAWVADPIDALVLHIQGSGRIQLAPLPGAAGGMPAVGAEQIRLAYDSTNGQPYKSVGRWLLDQNETRDATWPGIKAWVAQNPQRLQELLWSNPRVVFFREEAVSAADTQTGPRGAQGVSLTPGRSIAVDPGSIPYGTPVWLSSSGQQVNLNKLVIAQDTGSAITGAVRADYFAGVGAEAGELAGRLKQPLKLWVLWPKIP
jgi:membrane-bound lytic murein transglycosylase A